MRMKKIKDNDALWLSL